MAPGAALFAKWCMRPSSGRSITFETILVQFDRGGVAVERGRGEGAGSKVGCSVSNISLVSQPTSNATDAATCVAGA